MREAKLARPVSAPVARRTAAIAPRPASAIGNRALRAAVAGTSALPRPLLAPGPIHAWTDRDEVANGAGGPRAPWDRAGRQQAALAALTGGVAGPAQRERLGEELRRQVPDVGYMEQVAAGARTVVTLIVPGNGPLGLKTLNDDVVGYQINNSMIGPRRNEVVKNAFLAAGDEPGASPFVVTEQTYKMTTATSDLPPLELRDAMREVLSAIDRDVRDVYLDGLRYGLTHWRAQSTSEDADERTEAERRVGKIQEAIEQVEAPGFRLDFQFGMAPIERGAGGAPAYAEALAAHLRASQATLMSREPTQVSTPDVGDSRGQIYDRDVFRRFCEEGESLRQQIIDNGNTLTHHGRQYRVFVGSRANRDVLRDVRKAKVKEDDLASADERQTLHLFQRYFLHINAFDNLRDFTSGEVGQIGGQIARARRLIDSVRDRGPVDAREVTGTLHKNPATSEVIPRQDTAAEAVFYNAGQSRSHRIIVSCDIRDMGVDVVQDYGEAMHRVGRRGEDPDKVARQAADPMVRFRRHAILRVHRGYRTLVWEAIESAEQRGDRALADQLRAEKEPSLLMGGDEITLSLHEGMRPYLPRLAAALMNPTAPRARVAISTTGGDRARAVEEHIQAQQRADPAHSVLKYFEAEQRALELMIEDIDNFERQRQGAALVSELGLNLLYAENEGAGIVLRRNDTGAIVDSKALRERISEVKWRLHELEANPSVVTHDWP